MSFDDNIKTQAYHRQKKRCAICGKKLDATYEAHHILRKADGGKDTLDNCAILHESCHTYDAHRGGSHQAFSLDRSEFRYLNG